MRKIITVTHAMENYLKVIYELIQRNGMARVTDIADRMHVSKATVSQTTDKLVAMGCVKKEKSKGVWLTELGKEKAESVKETFHILDCFLTEILDVPKNISQKDACLMEHILSQQTIVKINNYMMRKIALNNEV
ncbi:MAG: metal-dependent transcriptional regulator [Anaerotignum sp.]|nr:metal-dependent transcriptional regulator [Anaerotignum sp.]